jgi:hypothetical protein
MTNRCVRAVVPALLFVVPAALVAQTSAPTDADQHLKALYTAEWDWRQQELAREPGQVGRRALGDRLPRRRESQQRGGGGKTLAVSTRFHCNGRHQKKIPTRESSAPLGEARSSRAAATAHSTRHVLQQFITAKASSADGYLLSRQHATPRFR